MADRVKRIDRNLFLISNFILLASALLAVTLPLYTRYLFLN